MTQQLHSDPWSALGTRSDLPTDEGSSAIHPAFESGDVIGYDSRVPLPDLCIKCAQPRPPKTRTLRHRRPGRPPIAVSFPICEACLARHRATHFWMFLAGGFLLLILLVFAANDAAGQVVSGGILTLVMLAAWGATVVKARSENSRWRIDIDQYDSDGFVRVSGVHPVVRASIVQVSAALTNAV